MNFVNFVNIKTNFPCNQNQFPHQIYWSSHRMTFTIGSWNIYTIWDWAWAWAWADGFRRYYFLNVFAMSQTPQYENRPTTIWKMDVCKVPFPLPSELSNSIQLLLILFISQSLKPFTRVFIEKSTSKYTHFLILSLKWKKCLFSFRSYLHWVWNVRFVFASHSNQKVKKNSQLQLNFRIFNISMSFWIWSEISIFCAGHNGSKWNSHNSSHEKWLPLKSKV